LLLGIEAILRLTAGQALSLPVGKSLTRRDCEIENGAMLRPVALFVLGLVASARADAPAQASFTASDGVKLHYRTTGSGPAVILLHGLGSNAEDQWFKTGVAAALARNHRVIAPDLRADGQSPRMSEDVVDLMKAARIDRAHVHGYGRGADILTQLLARHPERIVTASYGGSGIPEVEPERNAQTPADQAASRIDLTKVTIPVLALNAKADRAAEKTSRMRRELPRFWSYALPGTGPLVGPVYTKILASFVDLFDPGAPPVEDRSFVASDGVKLHYWSVGQGPPIVLLHGFSGSADMWLFDGVAAALAKNHRVLALDCRGHGRSDKPHDPARYGPQVALDTVELLDHLRVAKAHIHGFSLGGWILGYILTQRPERVLTAAFVGHAVMETDPAMEAKVPPDRAGVDALDRAAREKVRDPLELEARAVQGPGTRDDQALAAARAYPWKPTERLEGEIFPSRLPIDLTTVKIPVLAIMGALDWPNIKTHRMWREIDNLWIVRLPGKAHVSSVAPGYISPEYVEATVKFVNANDPLSASR
jgi:pimeloyl-ACP methyl ester carboxylesterase